MEGSVHFKSKSVEWGTPDEIYLPLHAQFNFVLDVCASPGMQKCDQFLTPAQNGLLTPWSLVGANWMNPPYGRAIGAWMRKAAAEAKRGATTVCLVPSRTDTRWFRESLETADEVLFVTRRIKFVGAKHAAPFPSCIIIFRPVLQAHGPRMGFWDFGRGGVRIDREVLPTK